MANLHISRHFLGTTATFSPRIPVSQLDTERSMLPRVCAAPTEMQCWEAICRGDLHQTMRRKSDYSGYYFFVYELEGDFVASEAADAEKTGETVCYLACTGRLVKAVWVWNKRLHCSAWSPEPATLEEAVSAYNEWQMGDIYNVESIVNATEWQD